MAIQFPDPNPTATSNDKSEHVKVVRLTFADFSTTGVASVKVVFPSDSTILAINYWKKTQLSGNSISAATLSLGIPGTPTNFVNAFDIFTPTAGSVSAINPCTNIFQGYNIPWGSDYQMLFTGTSTTGNPTAGEIYVSIRYVR